HHARVRAVERLRDFLVALAILWTELVVERKVATAEPTSQGNECSLHQTRLVRAGGRKVEAQHVAAAVQITAVENKHAVAIIDASAGFRRRNKTAQHRGDPFRIDRKLYAGQRVIGRAAAFTSLQLQQAFGIDRDGISFDRGGCRDRACDNFALRQQTLNASVDQARAELRKVQHAGDQRDQPGKIEKDDAPGEAGKTLRNEEMPRRTHDAPHRALLFGRRTSAVSAQPFGLGVLRDNFRGSIEHVVQSSRVDRGSQFDPGFYRKPGRFVRPPWSAATLRTHHSLKRYPTPYSVSIISKSSSTTLNFLRRRLMWLSIVRSST